MSERFAQFDQETQVHQQTIVAEQAARAAAEAAAAQQAAEAQAAQEAVKAFNESDERQQQIRAYDDAAEFTVRGSRGRTYTEQVDGKDVVIADKENPALGVVEKAQAFNADSQAIIDRVLEEPADLKSRPQHVRDLAERQRMAKARQLKNQLKQNESSAKGYEDEVLGLVEKEGFSMAQAKMIADMRKKDKAFKETQVAERAKEITELGTHPEEARAQAFQELSGKDVGEFEQKRDEIDAELKEFANKAYAELLEMGNSEDDAKAQAQAYTAERAKELVKDLLDTGLKPADEGRINELVAGGLSKKQAREQVGEEKRIAFEAAVEKRTAQIQRRKISDKKARAMAEAEVEATYANKDAKRRQIIKENDLYSYDEYRTFTKFGKTPAQTAGAVEGGNDGGNGGDSGKDGAPKQEPGKKDDGSEPAKKNWVEDTPTKEQSDKDKQETAKNRLEEMQELGALRDEYLRRVAGRARRAIHLKKDFTKKGVEEARQAYEEHFTDMIKSEVEYLAKELGLDEATLKQVTACVAFGEQRKLAQRLHDYRLVATGNYKFADLKNSRGEVLAENGAVEATKRGPLNKFYEWYGRVNVKDENGKGGKWYSVGAMKKGAAMVGIGVGAGAVVGLAAAPLAAGAIVGVGGGVLVSRITKAYMSTHIKKKSEDANDMHATFRRDELLNTLGNGLNAQGGLNNTKMTEVIGAQTKREVTRNRRRTALTVGTTAVGGALGAGLIGELGVPSLDLGLPFIDLPHVDMPDLGKIDLNPFNNGGTAHKLVGNHGNGNHHGNHNGQHNGGGKHGKVGQHFRVEQGSGDIREIQEYAAHHGYKGIDAEKATRVFNHVRHLNAAHNGRLITLDTEPSANASTYWSGNDPRIVHKGMAHWANRQVENAVRSQLKKEAA